MTQLNVNDYYKELETGITILEKLINEYKYNENIEIEIRIGRFDNVNFIPGLNTVNFYDKILKNLNLGQCWNKIETEKTIEFFNNNIKKIIKDQDITYIKKNLKHKSELLYENSPFDLRISVAEELKIPTSKINCEFSNNFIREKLRTKFFYKNEFVIDVTHVKETNNTVTKDIYEIEVELLNLDSKMMSSKYKAHSALLLIRDIINFCEELDSSAELFEIEITDLKMEI